MPQERATQNGDAPESPPRCSLFPHPPLAAGITFRSSLHTIPGCLPCNLIQAWGDEAHHKEC